VPVTPMEEIAKDVHKDFHSERSVAQINGINDLRNRVDCVQRSQAHIHEHIAETQTETRALREDIKTLLRYFLQQ
jgi:peptidoglycan hydrolase CwlO-like protein